MSLQVLLTAGIKQKTCWELSLSNFLTQQKLKAFLQKHILKHINYLLFFYPFILNFLTILVKVDLAQNYHTKTNFLFLPLNGKENFIFVFEIWLLYWLEISVHRMLTFSILLKRLEVRSSCLLDAVIIQYILFCRIT